MSHRSGSTAEREAPAWLEAQVYAPRRQRTAELVTQAVNALVATQQRVSLATVAAKSKVMDPDGRGISESAILGNVAAQTYYERHRTWKRARAPRVAEGGTPIGAVRQRVKADRDVARVRQRYLRLSKAALVERLLAVEHAHAEQEERWFRVNDELLAWRLRAEQQDSRAPN